MVRPKPKYLPEPRIWSAYQVATRLGWSESTFKARRQDLEDTGFPPQDTLFSGWDAEAIEAWLDNRSGLTSNDDALFSQEMKAWSA